MAGRAMTLFLIEDDDAHAELIIRILRDEGFADLIFRVQDGEEALDFLFHQGKYCDASKYPSPDIILLDLRLPKVDGHEVLTIIKKDRRLRTIPVVVLSSSDSPRDLKLAAENYVNSYITKPLDLLKFQKMLKELGAYWLTWNRHHFQEQREHHV
ncbi:response regulator [candidate division KSB1 bacterium]|nr:response regulator [candidate division KSB1 bacterium]